MYMQSYYETLDTFARTHVSMTSSLTSSQSGRMGCARLLPSDLACLGPAIVQHYNSGRCQTHSHQSRTQHFEQGTYATFALADVVLVLVVRAVKLQCLEVVLKW